MPCWSNGCATVTQLTLWEDEPVPAHGDGALEPTALRFSPAQLARLLGIAEPTPEQSAVISAAPDPLAVIAGAGAGKSETMAARLVWLVANGYVRPERVLGLTFTRKAAAELASRVRLRLDALRRVGLLRADTADEPAATSGAGAGGRTDGLGGVGVAGRAGAGGRADGLGGVGVVGRAGVGGTDGAGGAAGDEFGTDPVIATYHSYAGRLIADHALREA